MMPQKPILISRVRYTKSNIPKAPLLVLLHGEGGNEEELYELFDDADDRFVLASLKAPFRQTEKNFLWYTTTKYLNDYLANPAQIEFSRQQILAEIQLLINKFRCNNEHVYLFGFGQGGVMAINVFLTEPEKITGIAVSNAQYLDEFSSIIPGEEKIREKSVLITHGKLNQIYPIGLARKIRYELSNLPLELDYQEYEIGHYYSSESINYTKDWFSKLLDNAGLLSYAQPPEYSTSLAACKINVIDLDRAINFYSRFLGMNLVERTGKAFAFVTNNQRHHVIEFQVADHPSDKNPESSIGIYSIQFEVPDKVSFASAYDRLLSAGINVVALDKIICWCMTFPDPDGNVIEIIWDTRKLPGRSDYWQGRELPLTQQQILEEKKTD